MTVERSCGRCRCRPCRPCYRRRSGACGDPRGDVEGVPVLYWIRRIELADLNASLRSCLKNSGIVAAAPDAVEKQAHVDALPCLPRRRVESAGLHLVVSDDVRLLLYARGGRAAADGLQHCAMRFLSGHRARAAPHCGGEGRSVRFDQLVEHAYGGWRCSARRLRGGANRNEARRSSAEQWLRSRLYSLRHRVSRILHESRIPQARARKR